MSDRMPEDMPDRMPEDLPDRMPEDMPEDMPEHMPDRMPDRMPEDMSDRMPEDLPVRKCINVMVGITRSNVIFIYFYQNTRTVIGTPGYLCPIGLITKASLLGGVGFAVAMNWGQTACSFHDFSCRTGFGAPLLDIINHVISCRTVTTPPFGLKPRCVHPAGFHLWPRVRMPTQTHIQDDIHRECSEGNAVSCNVMQAIQSNVI